MLKYKILNDKNTELEKINYESYDLSEQDEKLNTQIITFNLEKNDVVKNGDSIFLFSSVFVDDTDNQKLIEYNFNLENSAVVSEDGYKLSLTIPLNYYLQIENVAYDTINNIIILTFDKPHFFSYKSESINIKLYNSIGTIPPIDIPCQYVTVNQLSFNASLLNGNINYFINGYSNFIYQRYDFSYIDAQILEINKRNLVYTLPLHFNSDFSIDLWKEENLTNNFVKKEKEKAINRIVNMEKQMYYPVSNSNGGERDFIDTIKINLHFREREGDNWLAINEKFWNGIDYPDNWNAETNIPPLILPSCDGNDENMSFFKPENQSDLLSYLNFTDNDVRYQKSKLKKSFLRLLFYDSTNQSNQNLLYMSTVFIDSGLLFGKYCRYLEDEPYLVKNHDKIDKVSGIGVNREPSCELINEYEDGIDCCSTKADEIRDELRLSSQFIIQNKYSTSSSDGFYLYLFAEDDPKLTPKDIYLKVEFNHAGYGRTLPFMMPIKDDGGIMDMQEIINKWYEKDDEGETKGFTIKKYYSYTYIKFKAVYDKKLKKHVYYMDNQSTVNDRIMTLNLYEAKLI